MNKISELKRLINELNTYRDAYYNQNNSLVSDKEYDDLFNIVTQLETETGVVFANSPTQTVGYE